MAFAQRLLAFVGLVLSCYALYVEEQKRMDPGFVALCDIGAIFSCSKVLFVATQCESPPDADFLRF